MASARDSPVLANRPSSDRSTERGFAEEEELLTGRHKKQQDQPRWMTWTRIGVATWAVVATLLVVVLGVLLGQARRPSGRDAADEPSGKRNLIFMVSDGMGPTSLSLTRSFRQYDLGLPYDDALTIDAHIIGQSRTRSTSSLVTDSAAGATAFSCGQKSYNGAISVLPDHSPCGTVLEAAKAAGYMTGLVVTTRITDATPACFAAHVNMRSEEDTIAQHMLGYYPLGRTVDLMLGGGRCHFLSNATDGSCRDDDVDLVSKAKKDGWSYIGDRKEFDDLRVSSSAKLPLLGLFADHDIPYEVDRRNEADKYPALDEMAKVAIRALTDATRDSDQGFFLMVEGSRIDHAGHANDPVAQVHEVLAYDKAMQAVLEFLEKDSTPGLMVSTSDHETGGLATARQLKPYEYPSYLWYPGVLANASHSVEWLSEDYAQHLHTLRNDANAVKDKVPDYLRSTLAANLGIHDPSEEEIDELASMPQRAPYLFADMISRRAQTGWTTHGHSAADVNIYTSNRRAAKALRGSVENTEVGRFLSDYLDVDTDAVTKKLRDAAEDVEAGAWMGRLPEEDQRLDGQSHEVQMDHYIGDFKKHRRCDICGM